MFDEAFMEDCIEEAPKVFLGCDLEVTERQAKLGGFRPDIVGVHQEETWIVEIQQRALDRIHLYKCLEYRDLLKQRDQTEKIKVVVVCNSIDDKYLPTAKTHDVEIIAIERQKFVELASQFCPKSVTKFFKRRDESEFVAKPRSVTNYHFRPLGWSGHDSVLDLMRHIYSECGRNGFDLDKFDNGIHWSILDDVENLVRGDWTYSLSSIVDPRNWNIDRLVCKPEGWQPDLLRDVTRIRKPEIEITAFVTSKDNLSIVWQPKTLNHDSRGIYKVGDWAHWPGEGTYGWSRPSNELIFIRDITRLRPGEVRCRHEPDICNWDVLDELFISLLKASYNWLCETLSSVAHVEKITDFEFDLVDPSPDDFNNDRSINAIRAPKRIAGWSIYNLEARKREEEAKWIENFEGEYKISVKCLTDAYNTCLSRGRNRVATNRTKYTATDLEKEGIHLSKSQLDQIVARLQEHHSHYIHLAKD